MSKELCVLHPLPKISDLVYGILSIHRSVSAFAADQNVVRWDVGKGGLIYTPKGGNEVFITWRNFSHNKFRSKVSRYLKPITFKLKKHGPL